MAGEWNSTTDKNTLTRLISQTPTLEEYEKYLKRKALSQNTIITYVKALKDLAELGNLKDTKEIETIISEYKKKDPYTKERTDTPATNRWKNQLIDAYKKYCKQNEIVWIDPPRYKIDEHSIQPPSEEKCKMLIACAKGSMAIKINISTQTGLRPIEIVGKEKGLKVKDFHPDTRTLTPTSTKGCNARPPLLITTELATLIQTYIIKRNLKPNDPLFKESPRSYGDTFNKLKKRLADKTGDNSFLTIRLYDLRHFYITSLLRKTQNVEVVRQKVGHKNLNTTQNYLHLLADNYTGEFIVEQTQDRNRAKELQEQGYTYTLTTPDGYMQFKKPK